jgi:hypothetical protein
MATLYVCDGCGHKTSTSYELSDVNITITDRSYDMISEEVSQDIDLCGGCLKKFRDATNMKLWKKTND